MEDHLKLFWKPKIIKNFHKLKLSKPKLSKLREFVLLSGEIWGLPLLWTSSHRRKSSSDTQAQSLEPKTLCQYETNGDFTTLDPQVHHGSPQVQYGSMILWRDGYGSCRTSLGKDIQSFNVLPLQLLRCRIRIAENKSSARLFEFRDVILSIFLGSKEVMVLTALPWLRKFHVWCPACTSDWIAAIPSIWCQD